MLRTPKWIEALVVPFSHALAIRHQHGEEESPFGWDRNVAQAGGLVPKVALSEARTVVAELTWGPRRVCRDLCAPRHAEGPGCADEYNLRETVELVPPSGRRPMGSVGRVRLVAALKSDGTLHMQSSNSGITSLHRPICAVLVFFFFFFGCLLWTFFGGGGGGGGRGCRN